MKYRVAFLSVVPSPYQRDLFAALARRDDIDLRVDYMAASVPGSPWPEKNLPPYAKILPGISFPLGSAPCYLNFPPPDYSGRDIVILNTITSLTAQWLMRAGLRGKPWLVWAERFAGRPPGWRATIHHCLTAPLHRATAIVGMGTLAERQYAARFPEPRHFSIPYHCDLAPFLETPLPPRNPGETVFLFCGQMILRKGLDDLLAAFTTLAVRYPRCRLLLVGREAELPSLLAPLPADIRARIEYAGFHAPENLPRQFARADVFVLPSRFDGWGVVINQALGAGLPIICSDAVGAAHDLIDSEQNGLRFPVGDVSALTRCMERFLTDPTLIPQWGAASRAKAANWTPDAGAAKWATVFHEISGFIVTVCNAAAIAGITALPPPQTFEIHFP